MISALGVGLEMLVGRWVAFIYFIFFFLSLYALNVT